MARTRGSSQKRERVTKEQLSEIIKMRRQGFSISAIARSTGYHRQTISAHLREKNEDLIAQEARKQVLSDALTSHFGQLRRFAEVELKLMVDASKPETQKKRRQPRPIGPISTDGLMGLPCIDLPGLMTGEWFRMHRPPLREGHLLASLREHTSESPLWSIWDSWRNIVGDYEKASSALWDWLEARFEKEPPKNIAPGERESTRDWLFGNILRAASGYDTLGPDSIIDRGVDDRVITVISSTEESPISRYLDGVIEEVKKVPAWDSLVEAEDELGKRESQSELRSIAREMDRALVAIELMQAFPGHCELCPV